MTSISSNIREDEQRNYDCLQGVFFDIAAFQAVSVRLWHTAHTLSVSHEWPRWFLLASRRRVATTVAGALTMLVTVPTKQVPIGVASKKSMSLSYAPRRGGGGSRPPQR
jgi:hypothetical protein